jgi:hypothetical protein
MGLELGGEGWMIGGVGEVQVILPECVGDFTGDGRGRGGGPSALALA